MRNSTAAPAAPLDGIQLPPLGTLVAGRWLEGDVTFDVLDKYSRKAVAQVAQATRAQVAEAVQATSAAAERELLAPYDRAKILRKVAELVEKNRARFTGLMIAEAGFTHPDAENEVTRAVVTLNLSAEEATRLVGETVAFGASPGQHRRIGFTIRVPLGVICAITPFNSPLNTVLHKIAPALAGGNGVVLKPSTLTPLTAALLCELFLEGGLPPELLALVQGGGSAVGSWLLEEQGIAFYTFTGSTAVGRAIQRGAGLRRTQLELGSIASTVVCADADLDRAVPKIANAAFRKAGQVCTSVQRLYVEEGIVGELTSRMAKAAREMPAGDPRRPETRVGPMITEADAVRTEAWVAAACDQGAEAACGAARSGSVYQPTVLTRARPGMRAVDEEIFAPVAAVLPFKTLREAIEGANGTPYGLAAGVFTRDIDRALLAARSLRFGAVHINETSSSRADGMPFGGVKESGFGHEGPAYSIREVTEERLITLNR